MNQNSNHKSSSNSIYQIKPAVENEWNNQRTGQFCVRLADDLQEIDQKIRQLFEEFPELAQDYRQQAVLSVDTSTVLTTRNFLINLYGLNPEKLNQYNDNDFHIVLNELIDIAENAFLRHIVDNESEDADTGAFKLRLCARPSANKVATHSLLKLKKHARFTIEDFETELDAAKVPRFYCYRIADSDTEKILQAYQQLPDAVKDLFFSVSWRGELSNDHPLYLVRDILLFANNERWSKLLKANAQNNRAVANEACTEFLRDFLTYQRSTNNFSLGAARKEKNVGKFTSRESSLLEFCKSSKYIGALWKNNFVDHGKED